MDEKATGNPVFDYRASFRRSAARAQRWLILGGLALFFSCGIASFFCTSASWWIAASVAGLLFCALGIAWGFHWRNKIRAEFRALQNAKSETRNSI